MSAPLPPGSRIGIIGGGQLGRMIATAAARLGYRTVILDPVADCPAAQVSDRHIVAAYDDAEALAELSALCGVVTYEFENVPVEAAERLAAMAIVLPPPRALAISQDRLTEKRFLNDAGIATAPFLPVDSDEELAAALSALGGEGVLKTRRLGYDGKGQRVIRNGEAQAGAYASLGSVPLILEGLVPFSFEFSVIAARGRDGALTAYDAARNVHRDGILRVSSVPAGIPAKMEADARRSVFSLLEALDYVGVIGVEFFALDDGRVLANEFAPRVHNSGHWTEAACLVSQFEQHVRAVCGHVLGSTQRLFDCEMENLIGEEIERAPSLLGEPDAMVTLYGKAQARAGRKMGHVTRRLSR